MTDATRMDILPGELMAKALKMKTDGYRIIQICATRVSGGYELFYSFGMEYEMVNLCFSVGDAQEVISISGIYSPAFLYENEIRDLFGVNIQMINMDYKGNLYRLAQKAPFSNK